jgi:hypothetical protein
MLCPKCNTILNEGDKFCHACGVHIPETDNDPSSQKEPSQPEEEVNIHTFTAVKPDEVISSVKSGNIFKRMIYILIRPAKEWSLISKEKPRVALMIFGYLLILGIVAFISMFFGYIILNFIYKGINPAQTIVLSAYCLTRVVALIISPIIAAIIINAMIPSFKMNKNFGKVMQLTCFSFTPVLFSWTLFLIPFDLFNSVLVHIVSFYSVFLFLLGYRKVLNPPNNKRAGFFFASIAIFYGVYYLLFYTVQLFYPLFHRAGEFSTSF